MAVYLVTWDLNREKPNYSAARATFIKHLERYQNVKDSDLDTVRFVATTGTAAEVSSDLRLKMDGNDTLFVTKLVSGSYQGHVVQAVWDWINANI